MIRLIRRKEKGKWIIKLFRIVNQESASRFNMVTCIVETVDMLQHTLNLLAIDFEINYQISRKSYKGFKKVLQNQTEIVYCSVKFKSENHSALLTISNHMLNWTKKPEYSSIDIVIELPEEKIDQSKSEVLAEELAREYKFEYGYCMIIPMNYDSTTERKLRNGIFSKEVMIDDSDIAWEFHKLGIREGYIKKLYPINYLNKKQLQKLSIGNFLQNYGELESISNDLYKWILPFEDYDFIRKNESIKQLSIITDNLAFLNTGIAKIIKQKMEPIN